MSYILTPITSSGITVDNYVGFGVYADLLTTSSGNVTLAGNVVINPTVVSGQTAGFSVRWNAELTLSTFSVSICGFTFNQSDVNQAGTFSCYYDGSAWTVQYIPDASEQPQVFFGVNAVTAATSGTTTWVAGVDKFYQRVSGAPTTLVGNLIYTAATAGVKDGTQMTVQIAGGITVSSSSLIVFGLTISAYDALNGGVAVVATYDATAGVWRSYQTSKQIVIGALGSITANSIVANNTNASAAPIALASSINGQVPMRMSDTLIWSLLGAANFSSDIAVPQIAFTEVSSAQLLAAFTTPIELLPASGSSGLAYYPLALFVIATYNSIAYATNVNFRAKFAGATDDIFSVDGVLSFTGDIKKIIVPTNVASNDSNVLANAALNFYVPTGNPTAGNSTLSIGVIYVPIQFI